MENKTAEASLMSEGKTSKSTAADSKTAKTQFHRELLPVVSADGISMLNSSSLAKDVYDRSGTFLDALSRTWLSAPDGGLYSPSGPSIAYYTPNKWFPKNSEHEVVRKTIPYKTSSLKYMDCALVNLAVSPYGNRVVTALRSEGTSVDPGMHRLHKMHRGMPAMFVSKWFDPTASRYLSYFSEAAAMWFGRYALLNGLTTSALQEGKDGSFAFTHKTVETRGGGDNETLKKASVRMRIFKVEVVERDPSTKTRSVKACGTVSYWRKDDRVQLVTAAHLFDDVDHRTEGLSLKIYDRPNAKKKQKQYTRVRVHPRDIYVGAGYMPGSHQVI